MNKYGDSVPAFHISSVGCCFVSSKCASCEYLLQSESVDGGGFKRRCFLCPCPTVLLSLFFAASVNLHPHS